jgi:CheY-like chemotaxis protein
MSREIAMNTILLVDDNPDIREILKFRLWDVGSFNIAVASNGLEALEVGYVVRPDLVFMDLRMPVMDGYEATRALHRTDWGKKTPVIAVTPFYLREQWRMALSAGCCDFIVYPIRDCGEVGRKIHDLLEKEAA